MSPDVNGPSNFAAPIKKAPWFRVTLAENGWIIRTDKAELFVCKEWADLEVWMIRWSNSEGKCTA